MNTMTTPAQSDKGNVRGDVIVRGLTLAYPGLWARFMREIRRRQVDESGLTVREVLGPLIERWLAERGDDDGRQVQAKAVEQTERG